MQPTSRDDYYKLEQFFQDETDNYLLKLKQLDSVLANRRREYPHNLYLRVNFVISALESDLLRAAKAKRSSA